MKIERLFRALANRPSRKQLLGHALPVKMRRLKFSIERIREEPLFYKDNQVFQSAFQIADCRYQRPNNEQFESEEELGGRGPARESVEKGEKIGEKVEVDDGPQ